MRHYGTRRQQVAALAVATIAQWNVALVATAVAPLAPLFQPELGLTRAEVGFFSSVSFAGTWGLLLLTGSFTDRVGVRKMICLGQLCCGVMMLGMSVAGSFLQALAVMFAAGMGRAIALPPASKAIVDWLPPTVRATAMGIKQTGVPAGSIFTATIGPAIALAFGWRAAIAFMGVVIVAGGVAGTLLYREKEDTHPRQGGSRGTSIAASLREVAGNRRVWMASAIAIQLVAVQLAFISYLPLYLFEVVLVPWMPEASTRLVAAGGYLALAQTGGLIGRIGWGVVSDRLFHGRRRVLMAASAALSALMAMTVGLLGAGIPPWMLPVALFAFGVAVIGWNGVFHAMMVEVAEPRHAGTGVGICLTLSQGGTVAGPPLFGFIVDATQSYRAAWLSFAFIAMGAALVAMIDARHEKQVE